MENLFTYQQAAQRLGVSQFFISRQVKLGALRVTKLGTNRVFRITETDLEAFITARSKGE